MFSTHFPGIGLKAYYQGEKLPELGFWLLKEYGSLTQTRQFGRFTKGLCNGNLL